jgi:hypothetical protein
MANPLVAGAVDVSTPFTGAFLLEDGEALCAAIESGDWVAGGMAAFSTAADTIAMVSDPIGSLLATGLGWVMEHMEPLKGWMNDLTGDAGEVAGFAQTWTNVSGQMTASADELARVLGDLDGMEGDAIEAYRAFQSDAEKHLRAAGSWAEAMAVGLEIASTIVKIVHDLVRDAIAQVVGSVISYASTLVLTAGLAAPLVIEQVATRVASLVGRIGKTITQLLASGKQLSSLLDKLQALFKKADDVFRGLLPGGSAKPDPKPSTPPATKPSPGTKPPGVVKDPVRTQQLREDMESWQENGGPTYDPTRGQSWDEFLDEYLVGFKDKPGEWDDGQPVWNWPDPDDYPNGFTGPVAPNTLAPGGMFDRISPLTEEGLVADGKFGAPLGTTFPEKGLPPDRLDPTWPTTTYRVVERLPDEVTQGLTAPAFNQPGGGLQYHFPKGVDYYVEQGFLEIVVE